MKKNLLFILLLISLSTFAQTRHFYNDKGVPQYYTTIDTVMYFEFQDNCPSSSKIFFLDSLTFLSTIDTIEENLFRIEFNINKRTNLLSLFQSVETIKSYSFEYLDKDSVIHWNSGKIVLKIKEEVSIDSILDLLNIDYLTIERDTFLRNFYTIQLSVNNDPFSVSNQLYSTNLFQTVYPDFSFVIKMLNYDDNPYYNEQYYLKKFSPTQSYTGSDVINAWDITTGDPNIKIAVLDNGVVFNHPDLNSNLIYPGYDATILNGSPDLHGGAEQGATHGTKSTGVIVAINNNIGIVGVSHTSKVFSIRMARQWRNAPPGPDDPIYWYTNSRFIRKAFLAALENNCSVINCSWYCPYSDEISDLIDSVIIVGRNGKGIPVVVAAGNEPNGVDPYNNPGIPYDHNSVLFPAILDKTIAVGGYSPLHDLGFYNYGEGIDIIAPATEILTTSYPWHFSQSLYQYSSGTSLAAPMVAATIALMLSVNPELTDEQIKEILFTYTNKLPCAYEGDPNYNTTENREYGTWTWTTGYGALNTHAAVFESAFYGIPMIITDISELELCSEAIISISEFDIPEWVDHVNWILSDNVMLVEQISPFSIKVKAIGVGNAAVSFNIFHKDYTKTIRKSFVVTSSENYIYSSYEFTGIHNITNASLISGENIVKENCTLTITSQIQCTPNASIIVKPGGKLIINNGSLTNYCEDFPWIGIVVEGNPYLTQIGYNSNQGILILYNATISNAECAVKVGDYYSDSKSGGFVDASNSSFINNKISIFFSRYKNIYNGTEYRNKSTFTECVFDVNNDFLNDKLSFYSHVYLQGVYGIPFKGCSFTSSLTTEQAPNDYIYSRIGIHSFNSSFSVKPICNSSLLLGEVCDESQITQSSIFSGLNYGIVATSINNLTNIEINSTKFENNDYGIYISGVNNPKILKNIFEIGKNSNIITSAPVGIHIQNSTGFRIEENRFTKNEINSSSHIGLYLKNSGAENNQIYKNYFENLYIGQYLDGSNYSTLDSYYGLISLCNENSSNFHRDFIIGFNPSEIYNGINMYQSGLNNSGNINTKKAAGNIFTNSSDIDIQYENLTGRMINYYFEPEVPLAEPTVYSGIITIPTSVNICPTKLDAIIPSIIELELTSVTLEFSNLKYNYNQLIDAGNTSEMLQIIQGEWSEDIWELRTELLNESPYLSTDVLISIAADNLLPQALYLEICLANPDATKDESFLDFLRYDIPNPLPEYMIEIIIASWDEVTIRTELEGKLAAFKLMRDELHNKKTELMFEDSYIHHDELTTHLESRGLYSDYLTLAEIAIAQDNYNQASIYIDFIENNLGKLPEDQADEIASFRDYLLIIDSLNMVGKNIYNLDSTQISKLVEYAVKDNFRGAILTRNILCMLYNICLNDVPAPPKKLRVNSFSNNSNKNNPYIASVNVMPNPASTFTSFEWDLKSFDKNATLTIYDQVGKLLLTKEINTNQGQWVWDTKNYGNGVYVYILKSDKLILNSGKVVINK